MTRLIEMDSAGENPMSKFRLGLLTLYVCVNLLASTAQACRGPSCFFGTGFGVSFTVFAVSLTGAVFSFLPEYGGPLNYGPNPVCENADLICLDQYICAPPSKYSCKRVTWIGSYSIANNSLECGSRPVYCIGANQTVNAATVYKAERPYLGMPGAAIVGSIAATIALFSGAASLLLGFGTCMSCGEDCFGTEEGIQLSQTKHYDVV